MASIFKDTIMAAISHVKDPEIGLVDFYHWRNGELVFLCWRYDEPELTHWHGLHEGFAGRKPIDD